LSPSTGSGSSWRGELTAERVARIETDHEAKVRRYKSTTMRAALQDRQGSS
jgi:hypothetical protein